MKSLTRSARAPRVLRVHLWLGLSAGLYFLFLALTGIALNHRTDWKLEEKNVSHRFLPSYYRPMDEGEKTRLDIVIADLHSGLLFGKYGPTVNDVIAVILMTSTVTGFVMARKRARKQGVSCQAPRERYVASFHPSPARGAEPQHSELIRQMEPEQICPMSNSEDW